ncbi:hypothetical protein [Dulcicalothrix desertica]|uniref:hypothetical protein n=1 Tax=Dulcicalothrix desertica TaxID=32056 RepID=UPI000F8F7C66|nr:hypothetical protein [Dulcicalothrix desertica]TWH54299.1 hypothetical protein CAL7102_02318 [Dulcicalothrix desertica PCC 7102]
MFHRLLATSSLILTATSQAVLAESIEVEFSGTVPTQVTVNTPTIGATDKNNSKTLNSKIPITFTVNSNISTNITIITTSTPSGANTLIASTSKNSRLGKAQRHPTITSNNYIAPAGTTNLEAPVQQQSSHPESNNIILLTITP